MAKNNRKVHPKLAETRVATQWKPGQSGNPAGRPPLSPEEKAVKRFTRKELAKVATKIIRMTRAEIEALSKDPNATFIECMVAAVASRTIKKGDPLAFDKLMDRMVGKVKEEIDVTGDVGPRVIVTMPSNGREVKKPDGSGGS